MKYAFSALVSLALSVAWLPAASAADSAAAITAFDEATQLLEAGEITRACDKFAQSYSIDPQLGALLHLADCREQAGQYASAWSAFRDAAELAERRGDERLAVAVERAKSLEGRVSKLTIFLPNDLPKDASLKRNGKVIPPEIRDTALPVDGGHYEIEVSAPDYESFLGSVDVRPAKDNASLTVPSLRPLPESGATDAPSYGTQGTERSLLAAKWPAFTSLAIGVTGGVLWTVFGVISIDAKSLADRECGDAARLCEVNGVEQRGRAFDAGNWATVGAVMAGVGVVGAGALWLALPSPSSRGSSASNAASVLTLEPGRLTVRGTF